MPSLTAEPTLKVFLSYSRDDAAFADELVSAMEWAGYTVTIDRASIVEGEDWRRRLGALIADADTGLVSRNLGIARRLAGLLYFGFDPKARYLDFAGGYGLLTRLMRDRGFNFYWHDLYCENVFARDIK